MSEKINPCFDCHGQCCQKFLVSQMVFNHPRWPEILDSIQQKYPYIEQTEKHYHVEDENGEDQIPYLRCNLFDIQTGLCTNHNDDRPDFCLNTGEIGYFSPQCAIRHQEKPLTKLRNLFQR